MSNQWEWPSEALFEAYKAAANEESTRRRALFTVEIVEVSAAALLPLVRAALAEAERRGYERAREEAAKVLDEHAQAWERDGRARYVGIIDDCASDVRALQYAPASEKETP
jgi:hypothetical protein